MPSIRTLTVPLLVSTGLALLATASMARAQQQADAKWKVRGFADWTNLGAKSDLFFDDTSTLAAELRWSDTPGLGVAAEYRFSRFVGLELSAGLARPEVEFVFDVSIPFSPLVDRLDIRRLGLAVPIHLTPDARVDLWVAPSLSYYNFGDLTFVAQAQADSHTVLEAEIGDEVAPGILVGVDVPLGTRNGGGRWEAHLGASYHEVDLELRDQFGFEFDASLDPLNLRLGVSYGL